MKNFSWLNNWALFRQYRSTYRSKVLNLVTGVAALCVFVSSLVFFVGDQAHRKHDTDRDVRVSAKLLAEVLELPLYAGNREQLLSVTRQSVIAFGLSKVVVEGPDGLVVLTEPMDAPDGGNSYSCVITINNILNPEVAITGSDSHMAAPTTIGKVTTFSQGATHYNGSIQTLFAMLVSGFILWVVASYIGYALTRKTSVMFDRLVGGIGQIEAGATRFIDTDDLEDGASRIAVKINKMSQSLYDRENENLELHRLLAEKMEGRAQKAEQVLHAKLLQANKMSTLGLLVSSIAHEISNPNTMIRLQLETAGNIIKDGTPILESFAKDEGEFYLGGLPFDEAKITLVESINGINEQSKRINEVVQGLREYVTGKQKGEKKDTDVSRIVERSLNLLQSQIKAERCSIEKYLEPGLIIYANQFNIEAVIINLLQNAFRAVRSMDGDGVVNIAAHSSGGEVTLSVTDNGSGIEPDDIPHLCDPFFSRFLEEGGTGLGLFITKGILDDHNGLIEFISDIGIGTTVLLRFPYGGE